MSTEKIARIDFLALHGSKLIDNGYDIIPIAPGGKAPGFDGWERCHSTPRQLREWLENGHHNDGVGIVTKHTPAIDIDVDDPEIADKLEQWIVENIGSAPIRIGRAPRRLLLFRTETPFRKRRSTVYEDDWCNRQHVEVLGNGQQFVAYHIHPETRKPYVWKGENTPLTVSAKALPELNEDQIDALFEYFDELAAEEGWTKKSSARLKAKAIDTDNPFVEDTAPVDISDDDLWARLLLVPNPDDYDTWLHVGMALYHQFDGDEKGRKFWHEWSETAENYDPDALDLRWKGFAIGGKKRAPVTARYILKLSKEAANTAALAKQMELTDAFREAELKKSMELWNQAKEATQRADLDQIARDSIVQVARAAYEKITGTKIPLPTVRKSLAYSPPSKAKTPSWARPWVYDVSDDRFFNTKTKICTTKQGFDAMYDREALTKEDVREGRSSPSASASSLALNTFRIPAIVGRRYEPGRDPIFTTPEGTFANLYPEHEVPDVPEKLMPRDKANIERVKRHIAHLLTDKAEQRMFLDWMSWVVQNPGKHPNFAVLLQGVEGDGKSFFGQLLRSVMGVNNVRMLNAHILESSFTDWAVGQCVTCIEEVRLIKHDRFEVINRIKPFITNDIIEVHPKGKAPFNALNTTAYLLFTNYKDALPLDDNSRRYLILFSQWQSRDRLKKFMEENPTYYSQLYRTLEESAPALRKWLLNHEQAEDFDPKGQAPVTAAMKFMVRQAQPEFIQQLNDLIEEGSSHHVTSGLINITELPEVMMAKGMSVPSDKTMATMLQRYGWEPLGKIRVGNSVSRFYCRDVTPYLSQSEKGVYVDPKKVRAEYGRLKQEFEEKEKL